MFFFLSAPFVGSLCGAISRPCFALSKVKFTDIFLSVVYPSSIGTLQGDRWSRWYLLPTKKKFNYKQFDKKNKMPNHILINFFFCFDYNNNNNNQ
jgi:hypothetical protein